ncbi:MAG TPA: hypothetical protein VK773_00075 [Acidimicrobiales bacterium]|nr:hypothetical protein [Acidimicrobiales bacterium]
MSPNPLGSRMEQLAQALAERIVPLVIEAIDIDALIDRVDIDKVVNRVDVDKVIGKVDVDKIIDRVDVEKIIERVDLEKVIERVDINAIIEKVNIDALVEQTELGSIIARSTTGIVTEILDVIRAQGVGLDDFIFRWGNRLIGRRRRIAQWPEGPPLLVERKVAPVP